MLHTTCCDICSGVRLQLGLKVSLDLVSVSTLIVYKRWDSQSFRLPSPNPRFVPHDHVSFDYVISIQAAYTSSPGLQNA